ncbi:MAG: ABC transporter permease [Acidimicrobiales bacterium]|jgi:putative ABC transport system permease protein
MWRIALKDLQWRRRRLFISTLGTSLVFTMALVLAGLAGSFGIEADNAIKAFGADAWIVHAGTTGPFTSGLPIQASAAAQIGRLPGVSQADGLVFSGLQEIGSGARATDANLFGSNPGRVGMPVPAQGRQPQSGSEAMVDDALPYTIGQRFVVGGRSFTVVGLLHDSTLLSGTPNVFVTLRAAQQLVLGGQPLVTAVLTRGTPAHTPAGFHLMTLGQVKTDMTKPLAKAQQVVAFIEVFLWLIAACIIGSVVYVSALEKTRDFAVLKATGTSNGQLMGTLALQATVISLAAAAIAAGVATVLAPVFPIVVVIPAWSLLALPILAIALGLLASTAGLRRAVAVEPAMAFGGP